MKIVYRAYDGEEFDTAEACVRHEEKKGFHYEGWDYSGKFTTDPDDCVILYIENETGAKQFIDECDNEFTIGGIDLEDTGWFYWDEWEEKYIYISLDIVDAFRKIFQEAEMILSQYETTHITKKKVLQITDEYLSNLRGRINEVVEEEVPEITAAMVSFVYDGPSVEPEERELLCTKFHIKSSYGTKFGQSLIGWIDDYVKEDFMDIEYDAHYKEVSEDEYWEIDLEVQE